MDRKGFFKTLIGTAAAVVVAPALLEKSIVAQPKPIIAVDAASIPKGVSLDEVISQWRQTGELPYNLKYEPLDTELLQKLVKKYGETQSVCDFLDAVGGFGSGL